MPTDIKVIRVYHCALHNTGASENPRGGTLWGFLRLLDRTAYFLGWLPAEITKSMYNNIVITVSPMLI